MKKAILCAGVGGLLLAAVTAFGSGTTYKAPEITKVDPPPNHQNLVSQSQATADAKSASCNACHHGIEDMHGSPGVVLGCVDCHGGDASEALIRSHRGFEKDKTVYNAMKDAAHVAPRNKGFWINGIPPANSTVLLNHESPEFIRFVNPGDLRVADIACGACHGAEAHRLGGSDDMVEQNTHSLMNHGAMLWSAAAYNNGAWWMKNPLFGQDYSANGEALALVSPIPVTAEDTRLHGLLPEILPLPRFELGQPGNIFRIFEKGGEKPLSLGSPDLDEPPGAPEHRLSDRGLGTLQRIDPTILNAQKTRLHDPLLGFYGSNNAPGDYRSSGCTACHVVYANDRSPYNSGWYSKYGNQGLSYSLDPTIPKNERGHPIKHRFTTAIPSSMCIICHMFQGNNFVNPYLGFNMWDDESDAEFMYPKVQKDPTEAELLQAGQKDTDAAGARGLWTDLNFLEKVSELNPKLRDTQFADYHGHGWIFRAVFKKDRTGHMLDANDNRISPDDPDKFAKAVHLKDIHLSHGMQCVDCHFVGDVHGNGMLYGESRNATTITCVDCHGTVASRPTLITSGAGGRLDANNKIVPIDLKNSATMWGPRFIWQGNKLFQQSAMSPDIRWEIPQTVDVIDPLSPMYNAKAAYAKTLLRDGKTWGAVPGDPKERQVKFAHDNSKMDCQICHTSWATSCFGCHLPMKANEKLSTNKFEGTASRNYTSYNPQVVRDDVFMLGLDGTVKKNRLAVIRSSSAVVVGSQNNNREWGYSQQQTVSWEGYSGQAFNPHFAHTTSGVGTTKNCTDCHLSAQKDNNAIMAQLLGFGTGTVNFFGRYAYLAAGDEGLYGVVWTEPTEPQAVIGSHLQSIAYPRNYAEHLANGSILKEAYHNEGGDFLSTLNPFAPHIVQDIELRGEYLYTAAGPAGMEVLDVANIDQKGFSERIQTAPVSPLGQRTYVRTPYATSVTLPSTLLNDPMRRHYAPNEEQPISMIYGYVFVTDLKLGLVCVNVTTLFDGNPQNNFLYKDAVYNPDGKLTGAMKSFVAGRNLYVICPRGVEVVDIGDPKQPHLVGEYAGNFLHNPIDVSAQFQYLFVTDADGLKVLDISNPIHPVPVGGAVVRLAHPHRFYVAREYIYAADGADGVAIINIEKPEEPQLVQMFNAGGKINDARAVQVGSVNASMYALVADGKNGLRVLQLVSPDTVPEYMGFSPVPRPKLIATYPLKEGEALAVSRGLDRDRVVDESGNQTVVFGRRGSRPFHLDEMAAFLRHREDIFDPNLSDPRTGDFYRVSDVVENPKDGTLTTRGGEVISQPAKFVSPVPATPTPEQPTNDQIEERPK